MHGDKKTAAFIALTTALVTQNIMLGVATATLISWLMWDSHPQPTYSDNFNDCLCENS